MKEAKQKTAEAKAFVEEQVAERERIRAAKEKMKLQIVKAVKIQVYLYLFSIYFRLLRLGKIIIYKLIRK